MKQLVICSFYCFLWSLGFAQTNIYYPLPTQNAYWRERNSGLCGVCFDYQYFTTGDTLVEGKSYTKIWKSGRYAATSDLGYCNDSYFGSYSFLAKGIRNDSLNKKVYSFDFLSNVETLLYDFDLNIGDPVPPPLTNSPSSYVLFIDSVLVGSNFHKRFVIAESTYMWNPFFLIEGVGSSSGLFHYPGFCFECCTDLLCVTQDGITIYPDVGSCNLIQGTSNSSKSEFYFNISPNPCEGFVKIHFYSLAENVSFLLYNELGQIVLQKYHLSNEQDIDLATLKAGFYYYNVRNSNNGNHSGKLFKK